MPYIDKYSGVYYEPDEAVAKGYCPECGRDLKQSSAEVEIALHWPRRDNTHPDQPQAEAHAAEIRRRMKLITDYFEAYKSSVQQL